jgi:hypothetical protein
LLVAGALACSPPSPDDGGAEGDGTTSSVDPSTSGPPGSTGLDSSSGTTAVADTSGMADGSFVDTEGPGEPGECRFGQDCPDGGKCVPRSLDAPPHYNVCAPVVREPAPPGGACTLQPYAADQPIDDCDAEHYCLPTNAETQTGICVQLCGLQEGLGGPRVEPETCARTEACEEYGQGIVFVCFDRCDPLAQACPEQHSCHVADSDAVCLPSVGELGPGQPCEVVNECAAGLTCSYDLAGRGCTGAGCCLPWCDTSVPDTCDAALAGSSCQSWWGAQPPLPGLETLGVCGLP